MSTPGQRFPSSPPSPRQVVNVARGRLPIKAVGSFVPNLTRKAFEKYGFSAATLITDWPVIVGAEVAAWTAPERLKWPRDAGDGLDEAGNTQRGRSGATLVLRVDQGRALDVQYKSRQLIERINAYFGYGAICSLRIVQGPVERAGRSAPPKAALQPLTREVAGIEHEPLRAALARLGAAVVART